MASLAPSTDTHIDIQTPPMTERQPTIPLGNQLPDPADPQFQTITANHRGGVPALQRTDNRDTDAQRGENYGDSSGRLWTMYLTEAEEQDKEITESWKGEAEGILVFTGLFSATVAAFIIESYKQLSPDSGDTTNALLTQISQQLVNISNGTPLTSVAAQISQPFKPTTSAVRVNVLWFLSLVLSLTCALSATLMQQWARRYQELAQRRGAPHKRARMRAYIFDGIRKFKMTRAILTMPTLLHLSVFLFFAGLIDFLFPINKTVAYSILVSIALFAIAYAILTILPNLYLNCPYRTPLSGITWGLSQISVLGILLAIRNVEGRIHGALLALWRRWTRQQLARPFGLVQWRETLDDQVKVHRKWLIDGLRKSVEISATGAPSTVDAHALEWTLTALDEDKEIEDFVARVPGFFDSRAVPDPTSAILPLMSDQEMSDPILGSRLYDLLKTCIPGTSPLTEEKRRSRLRVCLGTLWYCGRAYNQRDSFLVEPLPSYVRVIFASPEMTHRIQAEKDLAARVIGRCFGALVAKKLSADIDLRRVHANDERLVCLSAILGTDSRDVMSLLGKPGTIELASIVSLMLVADSLVGDTIPPNVLDMFKQTLRILSRPLLTQGDLLLPPNQVKLFHENYSRALESLNRNWLKDELQHVSDRLPSSSSSAQGEITFPEPAQGSLSNNSHMSNQPRENQVRIGTAPDSGIVDDSSVHT